MNNRVIHEFTADGRHRLVVLSETGVAEAGEWFEGRDLAWKGRLFAVAEPLSGLEPGVYSLKAHGYAVLT